MMLVNKRFYGQQLAVVTDFLGREERRYVAYGPVRSGKTLAGLFAFGTLAAQGGKWLLSAPTMAQVRNVLLAQLDLLFPGKLTVRSNEKRAYLYDAEFALYSGNDETSESAIRGHTFRGALVDEAVVVPNSYIEQVIQRCSAAPRKVMLITNPDSPYHPIKTGWIDRPDSCVSWRFTLDDNPVLDDEYKADLRATLTGATLQRMVNGEWVLAAGSIYGSIGRYSSSAPKDAPITARWIGVDYGHRSPTHAVLVVERTVDGERQRYAEAEWRHAGADDTAPDLSHEDKARAILGALAPEGERMDGIYCDPSAPALIAAFRRVRPGVAVAPAVNDVLVGIQQVQTAIESGLFFVDTLQCPWLAMELAGYSWDDKAMLRGERKPLKVNDHGADGLRYVFASTLRAARHVGVRDRR